MPAAFWDNPDSPDDTPVVRHAGDANSYQYPDERMLDRMPMGKVGAFAIVPAARSDGTSRGFAHDDPGVVHVDPDAPDGGAIVDYSGVDQRVMDHAIRNSRHPHQVYYQLGVSPGRTKAAYDDFSAPQRQPQQVAPRHNPHIPPGGYVTPRAVSGGGQAPVSYGGQTGLLPLTQVLEQETMQTLPLPGQPTAHPSAPPQQAPQYAQAQPQYAPQPQQQYAQPQYAQPPQQQYTPPPPQYYPPQPQGPDPMQAIGALTQLVQGLAQKVDHFTSQPVQQRPLPTTAPRLNTVPTSAGRQPSGPPVHTRPAPHQYEEADEQAAFAEAAPMPEQRVRQQALPRRQTLSEYQEEEPANDTLLVGFETLNIPFITGPIPLKATRRVVFELPEAGKYSGVYHDVVEAESCIVLVYDSRYEDGNQYLPPNLGERSMTIQIPHGKAVKKHIVTSMDITFSVGVLDCIVLPKVVDEAEAEADPR